MRNYTRHRFSGFAHGLDLARRIILGIVFYAAVLLVIILLIGNRSPKPKNGSLLVISPYGNLVESYSTPANIRGLPIAGLQDEILLNDLVAALRFAAEDPRIEAAWLRLDDFYGGGPASLAELSHALQIFRQSGKVLYASAYSYDNSRYQLASSADTIVVDRLGEVFPTGYGSWRPYYADGLDKLGADVQLFRSGESKSGAENLIRNSMSNQAREDEMRLLSDLWNSWLESVSAARGIDAENLAEWIDNYDVYLAEAGGNGAQAAMDAGLVDLVETGNTLDNLLGNERIDALDYLHSIGHRGESGGTIAVVPVVGTLVFGDSTPGTAGSNDIVAAIDSARRSPGVQALIVRIDSGGGDVRAGEAIRRALEETRREFQIPVIASLGNLAASGGYWIALESDFIISNPETITGSIGVYSYSLSFEKALAQWLGIKIDGYGTTRWSGAMHPGRTMNERTASIFASSIADIDGLFRSLVEEKRGLDPDAVQKLAGGIPWSGKRALDLGLIDQFGGLPDAENKAAELAGMSEWRVRYFDTPLNLSTEFLGRLLWGNRGRRTRY